MEPTMDLTIIWACIIGFALMMYVLLDGFDLGQGILFPFAPGEKSRDTMMNSISPVWDGNETWLVMGGAGLLGAFPLVYSIFLPALYIGVFLLLAGLIFRGIAFEFRFRAKSSKYLWDWSFTVGSVLAAFAQGAVVGAYIQGFETEGLVYSGGALDWLTPFTVITGLGLVAGYALLGSTWLIIKTEGELQAWAFKITPYLLAALLTVFAVVCIYTPFIDEGVKARWFDGVSIIWALPLCALACASMVIYGVKTKHEQIPFLASGGIFVFSYFGLLASKWPYIVPPNFTIWDAASAPESQLFLLVGTVVVIPLILTYTTWTYWIFRGKVKAHGYH
jgi:cytochrome d ubiquinol oxidase subunit II